MAEMVWCQSCKTVIWAYDHMEPIDLRGVANMLQLPCPKCKKLGNFDGWAAKDETFGDIVKDFIHRGYKVYDWWSAMRAVAQEYKVAWEPSPDNTWFKRPEKKD